MELDNMDQREERNKYRNRKVEREKSSQQVGAEYEAASKSIWNCLADVEWNNREQVGYHCGASKAHLTSREHIAYKRSCDRWNQYHKARYSD